MGAPSRSIDRRRRERIVAGVVDVVGHDGVEGLSHRKVARAAGVPASAPSYYFASIEDLLAAAMRLAADEDIATLREDCAGADARELPAVLARRLIACAREDRMRMVMISELYAAAQRRAELRAIANDWDDAWVEILAPLVGRAPALATVAAAGGLIQRMLMADGPPDATELESVLRVTLGAER